MNKLPLLLLLCFSPCAVSDGLPDLGDISQTVLTPLQERQIGQQSVMQIRASKQFFDDAEINDYLNQLGYRLVASSPEPSLGSMTAIAIAILAARNNSQASQAALASMQARAMQKQLDFTRTHEQEADRIGLDILQKSNFNIHAMPEFLDRLQKATRLLEGNMQGYLRTPPIPSERIAEIENRVQKQSYRLIADSLDFQLVRAKLIGGQKTAADAIAYFRGALGAQKHGHPMWPRY